MSLPPAVSEAWEAWKATPLPVDNFLTRNVHAVTYGVECDLDHQASYLVAMVQELDARNPRWEFERHATNERVELREVRERIEALELPDDVEGPLLRYVDATDRLLAAILAYGTGSRVWPGS